MSHPKQELLLISFCLFLYCCCLLFCCCFFYFVVVFFILLLFFFCDDITPVYFQWKITFWIKVLKWNFFVEIVSLSTSLPQQLSHSYSSVFRSFFFWFFGLCCFFLVSYTPNFKIFTRITFTYEFLPILFLSCLNAYFYAFFFSFFQRFLPSSHGVTGVPPLVWHFTLMACKIFDSAVVVNTNTDLVMSWVVEMVISSLLLLRELHPVTGKLSIVDVYMHTLLSGSDSVFYY